jgi:hypothetical protein
MSKDATTQYTKAQAKLEKAEAKAERRLASLRAKAEKKIAKIQTSLRADEEEVQARLEAQRAKHGARLARADVDAGAAEPAGRQPVRGSRRTVKATAHPRPGRGRR